MKSTLTVLVLAVTLLPSQALAQTADLILVNGNIVTVDEKKLRAEAVAIQGDRVLAVGSNEEIQRLRQGRRHADCRRLG